MRQVEFIPFWLTDNVEIYTIKFDEKPETETHEFIMMCKDSANPDLRDDFARIFQTLKNISDNGAEESMLRPEGSIKDRVCALPLITARRSKKKGGTLRLYCIRVSNNILSNLEADGTDLNKEIINLTINID